MAVKEQFTKMWDLKSLIHSIYIGYSNRSYNGYQSIVLKVERNETLVGVVGSRES